MRALLTALALLVAAPALAADHEISFEYSRIHNGDQSWDAFSEHNGMPTWGLRLGYAVHDRVAIVAGWHHGRRGRDWFTAQPRELRARTAFLSHEWSLGVKGDIGVTPWFSPYATAQGVMLSASWRFDDDPDVNDSPGQMADSDVSFGVLAMGGVELRIPQGRAPFTLGAYVEAGYGLIAEMVVCPVGNMTPGGFTVRSGVGLRF